MQKLFNEFRDKSDNLINENVLPKREEVNRFRKVICDSLQILNHKENVDEAVLSSARVKIVEDTGRLQALLDECLGQHDLQTAHNGAQFLVETLKFLPSERSVQLQKWCRASERQSEAQASVVAGMGTRLTLQDLEFIHQSMKGIKNEEALARLTKKFLSAQGKRSIVDFHLIVLEELGKTPDDAIGEIYELIQGQYVFQLLYTVPSEDRGRDVVQSALNLIRKIHQVKDFHVLAGFLNQIPHEERAGVLKELDVWSEIFAEEVTLSEISEFFPKIGSEKAGDRLKILSEVLKDKLPTVSSWKLFQIAALLPLSSQTKAALIKCSTARLCESDTSCFQGFLLYLERVPVENRIDCLEKSLDVLGDRERASVVGSAVIKLSALTLAEREIFCDEMKRNKELAPFAIELLSFPSHSRKAAGEIAIRLNESVHDVVIINSLLNELSTVPLNELKDVTERLLKDPSGKMDPNEVVVAIKLLGMLNAKMRNVLLVREISSLAHSVKNGPLFFDCLALIPKDGMDLDLLKLLSNIDSNCLINCFISVLNAFPPEERISVIQRYSVTFQDLFITVERVAEILLTPKIRQEVSLWFRRFIKVEQDFEELISVVNELGKEEFLNRLDSLFAMHECIPDFEVLIHCLRSPPPQGVWKLTENVPGGLLSTLKELVAFSSEMQEKLINRCLPFLSHLHHSGEFSYLITSLALVPEERDSQIVPHIRSFDSLVQLVQFMKIPHLGFEQIHEGWRLLEDEQRDLFIFLLAILNPVDTLELAQSILTLEQNLLNSWIPDLSKIAQGKPTHVPLMEYLFAVPKAVGYPLVDLLVRIGVKELPDNLVRLVQTFQNASAIEKGYLNLVLPHWIERGGSQAVKEIVDLVKYLARNDVPDLINFFAWDLRMNPSIPINKETLDNFSQMMVRLKAFPLKTTAFRLALQTYPDFQEVVRLFSKKFPRPLVNRGEFETLNDSEQENYLKFAEMMRSREGLLLAGYHIKGKTNEKLLQLSLKVCANVGVAPGSRTRDHLLEILQPLARFSVDTKIAAAMALGQIEEHPEDIKRARALIQCLREAKEARLQAAIMDTLSLYQLDELCEEVVAILPEGEEPILQRSKAFLLSTLRNQEALLKAAILVEGPAWNQDRSCEAQKGRLGGFELFVYRPDFHDTRVQMEMLIAERLVELYREKINLANVPRTKSAQVIKAAIGQIPNGVRYVPFHIYLPPKRCLFRGICARNGGALEKAALKDLLIKGVGGADLQIIGSGDYATWAKVGQVFASTTLDYVTSHFWDEDGVLMTIPTELFNEMQVRRSLRWQREGSLHAVSYSAIRHHSISRLFLSRAISAEMGDLSIRLPTIEKNAKRSSHKIRKIQQRHLAIPKSPETTALLDRISYLDSGNSLETQIQEVMTREGLLEATIDEIIEENIERQSIREYLFTRIEEGPLKHCLHTAIKAIQDPVYL